MFGRKKQSQEGYESGDDFGLDALPSLGCTSDEDVRVDIVFVHGLGGKKYETWTKDGVFWPRDLLARDVPDARIMTWGYDANALPFFDRPGRGSIDDHANKLIWQLSQERVEDYQIKRPIIFVAHSLGGLVVKEALFKSYMESVKEPASADYDEEKAAIISSTKGILFAGTPHRGTDNAKWLTTANKLASYIQGGDTTRLSRSLERGSEVAEKLQSEFRDIAQRFAIYSLFESYDYPRIGIIVPKDSALLGWHETETLIDANHSEMVKFAKATDNNYKIFKQIIQKIIRFRINGGAVENVRTRAPRRSVDSQRSPNIGLLEHPRGSSDSTYSGPLMLGQQNMGYSNQFHSSQQSPERFTERSTSRGSGSPFARLREAQVSDTDDVADLVEKGKKYLRQKDRNDPRNLDAANENLMRAREILLSSRTPDPAALVGTLHEIINVRIEMSFNKELRGCPEEKWKHLQSARAYCKDAFEYARQTPNRGDIALVKLQQAIIVGREAEVMAKWEATPQEVRQRKDEAVKAIARSLVELQDSGRPTFDKHHLYAESWMTRLTQT